jgi:hypothetical protein
MPRTPWTVTGKTVAVYLPEQHIELLRQAADSKQTTVSDILRRAIRRYFNLPEDVTDSNQIRESA